MRSNQPGLHPRLEAVVRRHLASPWRAPLHAPSVDAFEIAETLRRQAGADRPIVLDAGCGTGESTRELARRHPGALVVGIDQSAARLACVGAQGEPRREGDCLWLRADLATLWRLAREACWPVSRHYLLYPNPWPKSAHLQRRWHGHPVFPTLLALGGELELRSNWSVYVEEFCRAASLLTGQEVTPGRLAPGAPPISPFERKYAASGHALWVATVDLGPAKAVAR